MAMSSQLGFSTSINDLAREYAASVRGKTILITGVTAKSIGAAFVLGIAATSPKLIILAGRTKAKVEQTGKDLEAAHPTIPWRLLELDLADQDQIRRAAGEVVRYEEIIDVLVLNAGVMSTPWSTTKQGIEMQFGVNHVRYFLFANLIIPKILKSPAPRVVLTTSDGHRLSPIRFYDHNFDNGKTYNSWYAYGQSKTANMLYARSLAAKLPSLLVFSHHPGVINTELMQHMNDNDFPGSDRHGPRAGLVDVLG
ncbi:hypothetical protein PRZ48_009020 [Zasmidium cellare]|uniref:Uncharacterized protein n=1 Tax=Zasmidium cellare TaxID=395010 RepID=A0ABR0EIC0_ZASCE|nr:hypothetical protein PRZ48_009020 [Zasmidium cellare]